MIPHITCTRTIDTIYMSKVFNYNCIGHDQGFGKRTDYSLCKLCVG